PENSIGKLVAGATMQELAMFALDLQGQAGVVWDKTSPQDGRFQALLMRSPATRIEGGSGEILGNIIGQRGPVFPGEIRVEKGVALKDIQTSGRAKRGATAASGADRTEDGPDLRDEALSFFTASAAIPKFASVAVEIQSEFRNR